jgi:glycosyltransferase involved in cell wall biosynthesis
MSKRLIEQSNRKAPIIVVGQTPPPFGGQAVMIEMLLRGIYDGIELIHVRMDFSKEMDEMGRWKFSKVTSLVRIITDIYRQKFKHGASVLYYPPSGPKFFPVVRDIAILLSTRWLFKKVIFHFHATGLSEFRGQLAFPLRLLYDWAFMHPDASIRLATSAPSEGAPLATRTEYIVPNGIADAAGTEMVRNHASDKPLHILFVALLVEDKGILVMIEAFCRLCALGWNVRLTCMGKWDSPELEQRAKGILKEAGFTDRVDFPGVLTGDQKWEKYKEADVFCFPTFFHSETFPVVLLEAMCFSLPIVSTRWRGIPDVVEEGNNAVLVEIRDSQACANAISALLADNAQRNRMGKASRERFVEKFTAEAHWLAMQRVFSDVADCKLLLGEK